MEHLHLQEIFDFFNFMQKKLLLFKSIENFKN